MKRTLATALAVVLTAASVRGDWVPDPAQRRMELPHSGEGPIKVQIDQFLLQVESIDGATESFRGSVFVSLTWHDPRMSFDAALFGAQEVLFSGDAAEAQLATQWSPQVQISNLTDAATTFDQTLIIKSDGTVRYDRRIVGTFSSEMELSRFPYDRQDLHIHLESSSWDNSQMRLTLPEVSAQKESEVDLGPIRGWNLLSLETSLSDRPYIAGEKYSCFTSTLKVQRQSWFYMWDIIFPLGLVTFFALTCFFWAQETLSERIAQVLTCMLTVTAQNLAIGDDLPKISYFTLIDYSFILTYAVLLVVAIESIVVNRIDDQDRLRADRIDLQTAWITAIAYTAGMLLIFSFGL